MPTGGRSPPCLLLAEGLASVASSSYGMAGEYQEQKWRDTGGGKATNFDESHTGDVQMIFDEAKTEGKTRSYSVTMSS